MPALLVTYDLNSPGQKHAKVLDKIKSFGSWAMLSESSYAIGTSLTPQQVYNQFKTLLDTNDRIYIITLKQPCAGYGSNKVNNWLDNNLEN